MGGLKGSKHTGKFPRYFKRENERKTAMEKRTEFRRRTFAAVLSVAALAFAVAADAKTYYVSPTGDDANDGKKPETAFRTANKGFAQANGEKGCEVVFAAGTYELVSGVGCTGGSSESKRTVVRGETGNPRDVVIDAQGTHEALRLNKYITVAGLTVSNAITTATVPGAGIRFAETTAGGTDYEIIVSNCIVTCCRNVYDTGCNGAAVALYGNNLLVDSVVCGNTSVATNGAGVIIVNRSGINGTPKMLRCRVEGNASAKSGGGVYAAANVLQTTESGADTIVEMEDCEITGNTSQEDGAGVFCPDKNLVVMKGCTVSGNTVLGAECRGGGIRLEKASLRMDGCEVSGNTAYCGAGIDIYPKTVKAVPVAYCTNTVIKGNTAVESGGGVCVREYAIAYFDGCRIEGNVATGPADKNDFGGGGIYLADQATNKCGYVSVSNCVFAGNTAVKGRGGALCGTWKQWFNGAIVNCVFTNNSSFIQGGALAIREETANPTPATIRNCLFAYNETMAGGDSADTTDANGGAVCLVTYSDIVVENCTIVTNGIRVSTKNVSGGIHHRWNGTLKNCIVAFNTVGGEPEPDTWAGWETNNYVNCCGWPAVGKFTEENRCMNVYPGFVDWPAGDFSLKSSSPCRNRGARSPWMEGATDVAGNKRIDGAGVDIGCYEYQITFFGFALVVK